MKKFWLFLCFGVAGSTWADHPVIALKRGGGGPVTTIASGTLPQGTSAVSLQGQWIENDELSDRELAHLSEDGRAVHSTERVESLSLGGAYGISDRLMLGLNLRYIRRSNLREVAHHEEEEHGHGEEEEAEIESLGDVEGFGDLTFYGQFNFYRNKAKAEAASLILGLKLPTGETDEKSREGHRFEAELQPGSGSVDVLAGLSVERHWDQVGVYANVLYSFANEGSLDTDLGDLFNYNLAAVYSLSPVCRHPDGTDHVHRDRSIDLILELNGDLREEVMMGSHRDGNTGGHLLYLAPGLRGGFGSGWSGYVSVGFPVVQDLNGHQNEPNVRVVAGISKTL